MYKNLDQPDYPSEHESPLPFPKPGEIWQVSRWVRSPLQLSAQQQNQVLSDVAQSFLQGRSTPRYVMIVKEPEPLVDTEDTWQVVSVMLMSDEVHYLSDIDVLIPADVSGMKQDVLVETWHILRMLTCNLSQLVGQRLSRQVYDHLLTIGDRHCGLSEDALAPQAIQKLSLTVGAINSSQQPKIQTFHQQEIAWSDVLQVPVAGYHAYLKAMKLTNTLLDEALQLESELWTESAAFSANSASPVQDSNPSKTILSQWFQNAFKTGWLALSEVFDPNSSQWAVATRSSQDANSIRDPDVVQALVDQIQTAQDDEILWNAVENLWQLDPSNLVAGVQRVKRIEWNEHPAAQTITLTVALVQKANQHVGVLLRVSPVDDTYLPPDLTLSLLDGAGNLLRHVTAGSTDFYIQLKLSGQPDEPFSVQVAIAAAAVTEHFVI